MENEAHLKVPLKAWPFQLNDVRLKAGIFKDTMDRAARYLLDLEPDRLLSRFREYAGLAPKGEIYGGWESQNLSGHTLGHYLSGCALMYASSGDERFLDRVTYIIDELAECQQANGNGFAGGMPRGRDVFEEVKAGTITTDGFNLNGLWVPWYNLHKTYAGLIDAYLCCECEKALSVAVSLADWACDTLAGLSDEQFETMLNCEHGGMNESLATLYDLTGSEQYLTLAQRFNHRAVLEPLMHKEDRLTGLHANTQIPKLIGLAKQYELTGDERYRTAAIFFWEVVTSERSYVIGGNSESEHFRSKEEIHKHLTPLTAETCNTFNMLRLTRFLFDWSGAARYADYYERALYNHILASQEPQKGMMIYFCSLKPGHFHVYNDPYNSFWCCTGTGLENHVKYGDSIYFHNDDELYVNLFIASELAWREKGVSVRQETRFPEEEQTTLVIQCSEPATFRIKVRKPYWLAGESELKVNGEKITAAPVENGYLVVEREWTDGDRVEVALPMALHTEAIQGDTNTIAIMYGPIVLAGQLGEEGLAGKTFSGDHSDLEHVAVPAVPVLVCGGREVGEWVERVPGKPLTFRTRGVGDPNDVTLIPFYLAHHQRYSVYWDTFTTEAWQRKKDEYRAEELRLKDIQARTLDQVVPEMQPERDHGYTGENAVAGDAHGRKWRKATDGGWFSYQLSVEPGDPVSLNVDYWGGDGAASAAAMTSWSGGQRLEFEILVDGEKIAEQKLTGIQADTFVDITYAIPERLTKGKRQIVVTFRAKPDKTAGPVYACRVIKRN